MKKMAVVQDFKMATPIRVLDDDVFHITEEMDMIWGRNLHKMFSVRQTYMTNVKKNNNYINKQISDNKHVFDQLHLS